MKKNLLKIMFLFGFTALLTGCIPDGPTSIDQYDIVVTDYDDGFVFKGHPKYAMPDSVIQITAGWVNGDPMEFLNPVYANLILNTIKSNMAALGYELVTDTSKADFIILNSILEVENVSYYYDYWGYYYPYGWYYPYTYYTTYTSGTVAMVMIDRNLETTNPGGKSRAVWTGIINGVMEGNATNYSSRITNSVNQAFTQSSYLKQ